MGSFRVWMDLCIGFFLGRGDQVFIFSIDFLQDVGNLEEDMILDEVYFFS